MRVYVAAENFVDSHDLAERVRRWEDLGVAGVFVNDHLFNRYDANSVASPCPDPVVALSAIGLASDRLSIGTMVVNTTLQHPAFILRHFNQMAEIFGGARVYAGLGAGWDPFEYSALGLKMPSYEQRVMRLEATLKVAEQLSEKGSVSMDVGEWKIRDLPLSPRPATSPRILLGGGSDRLLQLAGRYADHLDLHGSSRRQFIGQVTPRSQNSVRRLTTTIDDLADSVNKVRVAATAAGRSADSVSFSVYIENVGRCQAQQVLQEHETLCQSRGVPDLDLWQCPYVLIGDEVQQRDLVEERRERIGLDAVVLEDGAEFEMLMTQVFSGMIDS